VGEKSREKEKTTVGEQLFHILLFVFWRDTTRRAVRNVHSLARAKE
jgi:hypothetical protein